MPRLTVHKRSLSALPRRPQPRAVTPEQEQEHERMRDQEQRHEDRRDEPGGAQLARREPDAIALVERVDQIRAAQNVERPDQDDTRPAWQRHDREQGQDCGREVAVRGRVRSAGQRYRPATIPQATKLRMILTANSARAVITSSSDDKAIASTFADA